jgi:hypothetical protein
MFAICGMANAPVVVNPGQPAVNPAAQFVASSGITDPVQLLNFDVGDVTDMIKAHHCRGPHIEPVSMVVAKNLQALIYFAKISMAERVAIATSSLGCGCISTN